MRHGATEHGTLCRWRHLDVGELQQYALGIGPLAGAVSGVIASQALQQIPVSRLARANSQ